MSFCQVQQSITFSVQSAIHAWYTITHIIFNRLYEYSWQIFTSLWKGRYSNKFVPVVGKSNLSLESQISASKDLNLLGKSQILNLTAKSLCHQGPNLKSQCPNFTEVLSNTEAWCMMQIAGCNLITFDCYLQDAVWCVATCRYTSVYCTNGWPVSNCLCFWCMSFGCVSEENETLKCFVCYCSFLSCTIA